MQLTQNNDEEEEKPTTGLLHTAERSFGCKVKRKSLFARDFIEAQLNHNNTTLLTTKKEATCDIISLLDDIVLCCMYSTMSPAQPVDKEQDV